MADERAVRCPVKASASIGETLERDGRKTRERVCIRGKERFHMWRQWALAWAFMTTWVFEGTVVPAGDIAAVLNSVYVAASPK